MSVGPCTPVMSLALLLQVGGTPGDGTVLPNLCLSQERGAKTGKPCLPPKLCGSGSGTKGIERKMSACQALGPGRQVDQEAGQSARGSRGEGITVGKCVMSDGEMVKVDCESWGTS